jgi:hypothetical protein
MWTITGPQDPKASALLERGGASYDKGMHCWWLTRKQAVLVARRLERIVDPLFKSAGLQV